MQSVALIFYDKVSVCLALSFLYDFPSDPDIVLKTSATNLAVLEKNGSKLAHEMRPCNTANVPV